jgi:hypothetical protein
MRATSSIGTPFSSTKPPTEETFTEVWLSGLAARLGLQPNTRPAAEVVAALGALHEFEFNKLKVALENGVGHASSGRWEDRNAAEANHKLKNQT